MNTYIRKSVTLSLTVFCKLSWYWMQENKVSQGQRAAIVFIPARGKIPILELVKPKKKFLNTIWICDLRMALFVHMTKWCLLQTKPNQTKCKGFSRRAAGDSCLGFSSGPSHRFEIQKTPTTLGQRRTSTQINYLSSCTLFHMPLTDLSQYLLIMKPATHDVRGRKEQNSISTNAVHSPWQYVYHFNQFRQIHPLLVKPIASGAVFQVYLSVLRLKVELVSVILIISLGQALLNNISIFSLFHFQFVSRSRRHAHVSVHSVNYNSDGRFFFDFREQVALVVMLAGFANHQTKTPGRNKKEGIHYNLSLQYEFSCFILHVYFLDSGFCAWKPRKGKSQEYRYRNSNNKTDINNDNNNNNNNNNNNKYNDNNDNNNNTNNNNNNNDNNNNGKVVGVNLCFVVVPEEEILQMLTFLESVELSPSVCANNIILFNLDEQWLLQYSPPMSACRLIFCPFHFDFR